MSTPAYTEEGMSTPAYTEEEVSPVLLLMTTGEEGPDDVTTTWSLNVGENMTGNISESDPYDSYMLYHVTAYMADHYMWFVLVFGVPGNLASIFTIMSMSLISSSKAHVAILALTDTVAIIMKISYYQLSSYRAHLTTPGCAVIMFVQQFSTAYANWVVVAMTTERFLAVWFPLRVGRMYTRRKAFIVLACLAVMTVCVYFFFFWAWTERYEDGYGYWCEIKSEYNDFLLRFYWLENLYYSILPCLFILLGNILIITNIKRSRKAQRHLTNAVDQGGKKARDQKQITVMLIVVSLVFLALNLPTALFYVIKSSWKYQVPSYEYVKFMFTARFIHLLADANHAVNFYLYFLSMSSFRRRFLDTVQCRRHIKRRPTGSLSRSSQTYLHSGHHSCVDTTRLDTSNIYSAYKYSSSPAECTHPLKSFPSSRGAHDLDKSNGIFSATSDV